jgi:hypothetical protein
MTALQELGPYLVLILVGFLPHEVWRVLAVAVSRGLDEESEVLVWVRAVATAVLAGVVAQLIVFPPGSLAAIPLGIRIAAISIGFAAFLAARRSVFVGVVVAETSLVTGALLFSP